jgi:hypothetical protein
MKNLETATQILMAIEASGVTEQLRRDMLAAATRYAHLRAQWYLATTEERRELDGTRTAAHNALIDSLNVLSRRMAVLGEGNEWRQALGEDRKRIGDFACLVHAIVSLRAR